MTTNPVVILTSLAALASAAAGGMMYTFSTFVMRGLDRTGPIAAITAMRGINAEADANAAFLLGYFGATILAVAVGATSMMRLNHPGSWWLLMGAAVGVLGAVITMAFNVPLNTHLDAVNPKGLSLTDAAHEWRAYSSTWTAWNHARTATSFVAAGLMLFGLRCR